MLALRERGVFVKQEKKKIVILIKKKLLFRVRGSIVAYSAKSDAFGGRKQ